MSRVVTVRTRDETARSWVVVDGRGGLEEVARTLPIIGLTCPDEKTAPAAAVSEVEPTEADPGPSGPVITAWNLGAEQMFGYESREVLGLDAGVIVPGEQQGVLGTALRAVARGDEISPFSTVWRRYDGRDVRVRVALQAHRPVEGPPGVIAVVIDQLRAADLDRRLRQSQRMAVMGGMTAGIAHNFNNLVTVMYGFSELVLASLPAQDPLRQYLLEVRAAAERATTLTRGLLACGRRETSNTHVDVNHLLLELEGMLRLLAGKSVQLSLALAAEAPMVAVSPTELEQAIVNLCANARDAMPEGGRLAIETGGVRVSATPPPDHDQASDRRQMRPGHYTVISVSDTGMGIPSGLMARIWEPFFTTKAPGHGTGLGLSTLVSNVREAGGYVDVESACGAGSTFRIYLPAATTDARPHVAPTGDGHATQG
jgi:two-component system cell cycle sensor histidine kinase/response regulator CckA